MARQGAGAGAGRQPAGRHRADQGGTDRGRRDPAAGLAGPTASVARTRTTEQGGGRRAGPAGRTPAAPIALIPSVIL